MLNKLEQIKKDFDGLIAKVKSLSDLTDLENQFLSRKRGKLTMAIKDLKKVSKDEVAKMGQLVNETKNYITEKLELAKHQLNSKNKSGDFFDLTIPGTEYHLGHLHPMTHAMREISGILERIGFQRVDAPEVEWDYYAFETLNMPSGHPARDEWETFFIDKEPVSKKYGQRILTPHTSSAQIREMEKGKLPIRMTYLGKCYRRQIDASHAPMFHQFEGLLIDEGVNITHLKGVLDYFVKNFFGADRKVRLRPHHFQFTEPSFEVDISCGVCGGKGCKLCKEGWLELGGSGMVHPNVLRAGGVDPKKYSGFAFGWGVERCFLMKDNLNIDDIRLLYKNDLRLINQF